MGEKIVEKGIETAASIINSMTKDAQVNSAGVCIVSILDALKSFTEKGLIDVDAYFDAINGLEYEKDLTKYLGRISGLKIKFESKQGKKR